MFLWVMVLRFLWCILQIRVLFTHILGCDPIKVLDPIYLININNNQSRLTKYLQHVFMGYRFAVFMGYGFAVFMGYLH